MHFLRICHMNKRMKPQTKSVLEDLLKRRPELEPCRPSMTLAFDAIMASYHQGGKLLCCGNGGSASDSLHLVGELMKGFSLKRALEPQKQQELKKCHPELGALLAEKLQGAIPAIDLTSSISLLTAVANDNSADLIYAQSVWGLGEPRDTFFGFSTSGNSKNVLAAMIVARTKGLKVITLTGPTGGKMKELSDICITAPGKNTPEIQEAHLPIYHTLSMMLEVEVFG